MLSTPYYVRFVCPDVNAMFSLHQTDILPSGDGIWIYFEDVNVDQKVEALLQKGIEFESLPEDQPWLWREAQLKNLTETRLLFIMQVKTGSIRLGS